MSKTQKYIKLFVAAGIAVVFSVSNTTAFAKQPEHQNKSEARVFSKAAGQVVSDGVVSLNNRDYEAATATYRRALALKNLNAYERSTIYQLLGASLYELEDYAGAIQAFESAIVAGGLLPKEKANLRVNIAQLLIASGAYAKGANMLEDWVASSGAVPIKYDELLWQAWSQAEQYDKALPWAQEWFKAANPKKAKHYQVLYFLYNALGKDKEKSALFSEMQAKFPKAAQDLLSDNNQKEFSSDNNKK